MNSFLCILIVLFQPAFFCFKIFMWTFRKTRNTWFHPQFIHLRILSQAVHNPQAEKLWQIRCIRNQTLPQQVSELMWRQEQSSNPSLLRVCLFWKHSKHFSETTETKQPPFSRYGHRCGNYQPTGQHPLHSPAPFLAVFVKEQLNPALLRTPWVPPCWPRRAGRGVLADPRARPCQPDVCPPAPLCKSSQQRCWRRTPRGRYTQLTQYTEDTNTASHADRHRCLYQYRVRPQSAPKNRGQPSLAAPGGSPTSRARTLALCDRNTHRFTGSLNMSWGSRSIGSPRLGPVPLPRSLALTLVVPDVGLSS